METLNLIKNDPWLEPYADAINGRHKHATEKEAELTNKGKQTLSDFASGYLYFGLHRTDEGWVSANGLPMPLRFSWLERLMTGKRRKIQPET